MFFDYGDDSVAQLGGVHLACEQASNLLTKVLEWGRLMSYLEQSTRYIAYDSAARRPVPLLPRPAGARRPLGTRYVGDLDRIFDAYSAAAEQVTEHVRAVVDRDPNDSEFVYRTALGPRHSTPYAAFSRRRRRRTSGSTEQDRASRPCCCGCVRTRSPSPASTPI